MESAPPPSRRRFQRVIKPLLLVVWIVLLTWLMLEIFIRVGFDALPPETQAVLQHVRRVPWDEEHLIPVWPLQGSIEYHARLPVGLDDYRIHWGDADFTFDTINLWGGSEGFRTREPEWPMDIVAFGDSFAFCWTRFEDCWVERLHSDHGWHVMNLGVPGTGSMGHRYLLATYAPPMEPAVVVWQWYGNDFKDDYDFARMRGEVEELSAPPPAEPPPDYGKFAEYSAVYRYLRDWYHKRTEPAEEQDLLPVINGREISVSDELGSHDLAYASVEFGYGWTIRALDEAHQIVTGDMGAEFVVVLIPTKEEAYARYLDGVLSADYLAALEAGRLKLLDDCAAHGWRCLDMTDTLRAAVDAGETIYNAYDFHLDASGNQLVADTLADYLIAEGILAPR